MGSFAHEVNVFSCIENYSDAITSSLKSFFGLPMLYNLAFISTGNKREVNEIVGLPGKNRCLWPVLWKRFFAVTLII